MFRRLSHSLPPDPTFPNDIEKLGYFINDHDQIRMIADPRSEFKFMISKNERVNDVHKEAMNACIRRIVLSRLEDLSLQTLRLPFDTAPDRPHIPILTSSHLRDASRVLLFLGGTSQDLGVLAYRMMNHSIDTGSVVNFVKGAHSLLSAATSNNRGGKVGLVIGNPGQLIWSNIERQAVTYANWKALPRKSAIHPLAIVDENRNRVPGHESVSAHVSSIFEKVLSPTSEFVDPTAKISVIALEDTAESLVRYLAANWINWSQRIEAIVFGDPFYLPSDLHPMSQDSLPGHTAPTAQDVPTLDNASSSNTSPESSFASFISKRSRAYRITRDPKVELDEPCAGRENFGCNCYGSGEEYYSECTMPVAWQAMLSWLTLVWTVGESFEEIAHQTMAQDGEGGLGDAGWGEVEDDGAV